MTSVVAIGFVALLSLLISVVVLILVARRKRFTSLPDGDYIATIIKTRETLTGTETVFKVDEPKEFRGHTVTIVRGKPDG